MRTWTAEDLGGSVVIKLDGLRIAEMDVEDVGLYLDGDADTLFARFIVDACNAAEQHHGLTDALNPSPRGHAVMEDMANYEAMHPVHNSPEHRLTE